MVHLRQGNLQILNSELYFSWTGCPAKAKWLSLLYYFRGEGGSYGDQYRVNVDSFR